MAFARHPRSVVKRRRALPLGSSFVEGPFALRATGELAAADR